MRFNIHSQLKPGDTVGSSERIKRPEWQEIEQERRDRILLALFRSNSKWPFFNEPIIIGVINAIIQNTEAYIYLPIDGMPTFSEAESEKLWNWIYREYCKLLQLKYGAKIPIEKESTIKILQTIVFVAIGYINDFFKNRNLISTSGSEEMFQRLKVEASILDNAMRTDQILEPLRKARWQEMKARLIAKYSGTEVPSDDADKTTRAEFREFLEEKFPHGSPFKSLYAGIKTHTRPKIVPKII